MSKAFTRETDAAEDDDDDDIAPPTLPAGWEMLFVAIDDHARTNDGRQRTLGSAPNAADVFAAGMQTTRMARCQPGRVALAFHQLLVAISQAIRAAVNLPNGGLRLPQ